PRKTKARLSLRLTSRSSPSNRTHSADLPRGFRAPSDPEVRTSISRRRGSGPSTLWDDVDSIEAVGFLLQMRFDASYEGLDLRARKVVCDVNASNEPHPAWAKEGEQQFANVGHAGLCEDEGAYCVLLSGSEGLRESIDILARRTATGAHPGADK